MPIEKHPVFIEPSSHDSKLWRYMSLSKYISLLKTESLYLCNLEVMSNLDPFEGTYPSSKFQHREWKTIHDVPPNKIEQINRFQPHDNDDKSLGLARYKNHVELRIRQSYANRKSYFINCWHANEYESAAMWEIYSHNEEGVAIVTTPKLINDSLSGCSERIFCGLVSYGDYEDQQFEISEENAFNLIMKKRESYSHEREYRIVYWDTTVTHKKKKMIFSSIGGEGPRSGISEVTMGRKIEEIEEMEVKAGYLLKCDLSKMIQKIYVSPLSRKYLFDAVCDVTQKYSIATPVIQSNLMTTPLK